MQPFRKDSSAVNTVKILIITVIALVIPAFFLLVLIMSTHGRLSTLRRRCQQLAAQRGKQPDDQGYAEAVARYDAARTAFPASFVSKLFGFGPLDHSTHLVSPEDSRT